MFSPYKAKTVPIGKIGFVNGARLLVNGLFVKAAWGDAKLAVGCEV